MNKSQLNLRVSSVLARDLRVEAAQMGMRLSEYVEAILARRLSLIGKEK